MRLHRRGIIVSSGTFSLTKWTIHSAITPRSSLAEYAEVATALKLNQQRPRVMSEPPPPPPTVVVQDMSDDNEDGDDLGSTPKLDKGKQKEVIVFTPEPSAAPDMMVRHHHNGADPAGVSRPPIAPLSWHNAKGKRVMSMPPGGLRSISQGDVRSATMRPPGVLVRGGRALRVPPKLSTDGLVGIRRERWSEVPAQWRQGTVDPLRCHSVDQLPPADCSIIGDGGLASAMR